MKTKVVIIESADLRDELANNKKAEEALEKVKAVPLFPNTLFVGTHQAANYYEVDYETIKAIVKRHRSELIKDGMSVLSGKELKKYKEMNVIDTISNDNYIKNQTKQFTILPKKALLRIGMLLKKSKVAEELRTYLLNLEKNATKEQKAVAIKEIEESVSKNNLTLVPEKTIELLKEEYSKEIIEMEHNAKKELLEIKSLIDRSEMFGLDKNKVAMIIHSAKLSGQNPEIQLYGELENNAKINTEKKRGVLRLKINLIAEDYYFENYQKVYHIFSDKMRFKIGVNMADIRARAKKTSKLKDVPSYLDLIAKYNAWDEASEVLDEMIYECIDKERREQKKETYAERRKRMANDLIKNEMHKSSAYNNRKSK